MRGYFWDDRKKELVKNYTKGSKAFCYKAGLLTLEGQHPSIDGEIKGPDEVENEFGDIDNRGDDAIKCLLKNGPESLDEKEKCDFARLLMSLITREPEIIDERLDHYLKNIDENDPKARLLAERIDPSKTPSEHYAELGYSVKDHVVRGTRNFTDRERVIDALINLPWHVVRLGEGDGTFVLADRPLVRRISGYIMTCFLPLTPKVAFVADERPDATYQKNPREIARDFNIASCAHAKKYVFCMDDNHEPLLNKYLHLPLAKKIGIVERHLLSAGIG